MKSEGPNGFKTIDRSLVTFFFFWIHSRPLWSTTTYYTQTRTLVLSSCTPVFSTEGDLMPCFWSYRVKIKTGKSWSILINPFILASDVWKFTIRYFKLEISSCIYYFSLFLAKIDKLPKMSFWFIHVHVAETSAAI